MRKPVVVVALTLAVATAGAAVALAVAASSGGVPDAAPTAPASSVVPSASAAVTADDYCYVEAMIYYRVEESELARTLLRKEGTAPAARALADAVAERAVAELDDLREWYVSWADARPATPPADGLCGGHGADHAQMPGMPSWSRQLALADAAPPAAEREFTGILRDQTAGMVALVTLVLDGAPHPAVAESARRVLAHAEADLAALDELAASSP
ncbi:DUF305 domain-containing protein [Microbacterium cremeum]|uniref:DUF305 domain-containing protein n=1 Tax=Microbacterium cremeum TaxID=2782169 RepID=UPI0018890D14|nr:DUF305 domain-containing protein [Microbacterium cremeum]